MSVSRVEVRLGILLLAVVLVGACGASATTAPATKSPTASPDQALIDDLDAAWSGPYDEAAVAALYAPEATFYDTIAGETSNGLEEIQAKIKEYADLGFKATSTTVPIRQGNYVAVFDLYGTDGQANTPGLAVMEMRDGKILNQWVYPAD